MTESTAAGTWLVGLLRASSGLSALLTGGVWLDAPPDGTAPNYVVVALAMAKDTTTSGGRVRCWTDCEFIVRGVTLGNTSSADAIEAAIEAAIGNLFAQDSGSYRFDCLRLSPLNLVSTDHGRHYRYGGGRYRVTVRTLI